MFRFYLAYAVFRRYNIDDNECKKTMSVLSVGVVPLIVLVCYIRYFFLFDGVLAKLAELFFIYTQTFAGLALFYWLYLGFSHIKERRKIIKVTDRYSYFVYLTHSFFIGYKTSVIDKFESRALGIITALLFTAVLSTLVLMITKPINKRINNALK